MFAEPCYVTHEATFDQLRELVGNGDRRYIARGLGRSYGDASLNRDQGVLLQHQHCRFLALENATGILTCEAGLSLREIIHYLLPRGWFPPVTPGTKDVTVGGAIAADVHGKNHHVDGSFGNFVLDLELLTADGNILTCSPTENCEVFWATIGGMGLTGIILRARIRLRRVESAYCNVTYRRTQNLDETLECFQATDAGYRYSVAWVDCLASGKKLGRSIVMLGNEAREEDLPERLRRQSLKLPDRKTIAVPRGFPGWILNPWTVRAFNTMYYARHKDSTRLVDFDAFFYPLDRMAHWNRMYGRGGFIQYQAFFPTATSRRGLIELLELIAQSKQASFLAVLKSCGAAGQGMLSYLQPGHTLALDLPNDPRELMPLVRRLDRTLLKFGGRIYLAKDAVATPETFAAMYPRLEEFKDVKSRVDPQQQFTSSQARRLGIVESRPVGTSRHVGLAVSGSER